jgi:hypothetical protein
MLHERTKVRKADACLCSVTTNQISLFVQPNTAHFRHHIYFRHIYTSSILRMMSSFAPALRIIPGLFGQSQFLFGYGPKRHLAKWVSSWQT